MDVNKLVVRLALISATGVLASLVTMHLTTSSRAEGFVAGTTPDRRPETAPRVNAFEKTPEWFAQALRGVEQPIPPSLGFLNNQGGWYTPFNHRGMTPPYDIRGLHAGPAADASDEPANAN
jgi:hypothetical protein